MRVSCFPIEYFHTPAVSRTGAGPAAPAYLSHRQTAEFRESCCSWAAFLKPLFVLALDPIEAVANVPAIRPGDICMASGGVDGEPGNAANWLTPRARGALAAGC